MALGDAMQKRMAELAKRQAALPGRLAAIAEGATLRAVEAAAERTPPNDGDIRGVHTLSGELAQHWATDSRTTPVRQGNLYITALNNDKQYAGYVNDGHRMDRHFVPGLYVDEDGLLSFEPGGDVGLMVGTKTTYVPGRYMKEAGEEQYKETCEIELRRLVEEAFR